MSVTLIIGGDMVPTETNFKAFSEGNTEELWGKEISAVLDAADFRFFNLEVPLTDVCKPIPKCGPNLIAPTSCVRAIKKLDALIGLANNHTLDQDEAGLFDTFKALEENGIPFMGAAENLAKASKPYVFEKDGVRIGIYDCAEHEFTIAGENSAGANPYEPDASPAHIKKLKSTCDYVVVIYHGGREYYRYGSPRLQQTCRTIIDAGADLVVCQHSHCVGTFEDYKDGKIIYGQGNFLFDYIQHECWETALLLKVTFDSGVKVDYIPLYRYKNGVRMATGDKAKEIMDGFYGRAETMKNPCLLQKEFEKCALTSVKSFFYLMSLNEGQPIRDEDIEAFEIGKYKKNVLLGLYNSLRCEVHNEILMTAFLKMAEDAEE